MEKLRIIVGGYIGLLPAGGVTWDYVQYPLGLHLMGHEVYYIEDTGLYPIYQKPGSTWDDASDCIQHLSRVMTYFGMPEQWAYRDEASGKCFGLSEAAINTICRDADVFINISCSTILREEYLQIPLRILIDSDPMFTQIQYETTQSFTPGSTGLKALIDQHTHHFTFGENVDAPDCKMPQSAIVWRPTRQPVCLEYWPPQPIANTQRISTLMNWSAGKKLEYGGDSWGQKDVEFPKILAIPEQFPQLRFSVVINQTGKEVYSFPRAMIESRGWDILDPDAVAGNWSDYRDFLTGSFAELSVAKETYVKARTGWFSCRSACYLAAGVPVICQDTGWSRYIAEGQGLFAFSQMEEAVAALQQVLEQARRHAMAARGIAEDFFDHRKVLHLMLNQL